MQRKPLKKFLISAGTVCVLAPAALAATVIMHRGNGDAGFGNTLQDAMQKVLLFSGEASPPAASVANERSNADNSAKGQIPLGAGPYLSGVRLVDLMKYRTDFARLDLGDDGWPGNGAHGAPAGALAAFADMIGPPGQQKFALASTGMFGGQGGSLPGMPWSGPGQSGGGVGSGGSGGLPGMGGSGGSDSGPEALIAAAGDPAGIPASGGVTGPAVTVVPLPATVWMLFAAFGALGIAVRRNRSGRALYG